MLHLSTRTVSFSCALAALALELFASASALLACCACSTFSDLSFMTSAAARLVRFPALADDESVAGCSSLRRFFCLGIPSFDWVPGSSNSGLHLPEGVAAFSTFLFLFFFFNSFDRMAMPSASEREATCVAVSFCFARFFIALSDFLSDSSAAGGDRVSGAVLLTLRASSNSLPGYSSEVATSGAAAEQGRPHLEHCSMYLQATPCSLCCKDLGSYVLPPARKHVTTLRVQLPCHSLAHSFCTDGDTHRAVEGNCSRCSLACFRLFTIPSSTASLLALLIT